MILFINKVTPILMVFFLGYLLQRLKLFKVKDGELLLKIVFYVTMPFLILSSTLEMEFKVSLIFIPFIAASINLVFFTISYFIGRKLKLEKKQLGSFILGSSILNTAFTLPFFIAAYGHEGLIQGALFDVGNVFMIFTFFYYIAVKYGSEGKISKRLIVRKLLILPPLWGLVAGLTVNFLNLLLPQIISDFSTILGNLSIPLVMLALGLIFHPKIKNLYLIFIVLLLRLGGGLVLGFIIVSLIPMDSLTKAIVFISCAAPVGYNTLVLSSMEKLDEGLAASLVSISLIIGIFTVPLIIVLIHMFDLFSIV